MSSKKVKPKLVTGSQCPETERAKADKILAEARRKVGRLELRIKSLERRMLERKNGSKAHAEARTLLRTALVSLKLLTAELATAEAESLRLRKISEKKIRDIETA